MFTFNYKGYLYITKKKIRRYFNKIIFRTIMVTRKNCTLQIPNQKSLYPRITIKKTEFPAKFNIYVEQHW